MPPITDRRPAHKFVQAGFVDVASYLYEKTRDDKYLEPTGDGAGGLRIDQFWVSKALAPAIVNYWTIDVPSEASDHKGIAFELDTDRIDASATWPTR